MDWNDVRYFLALARTGSLRSAGALLGPVEARGGDPTLRRLDRPDVRHMGDFWLLSHPDLRDNARLRAARECVVTALTSRTALFAGDGWSENAPEHPGDTPCEDGASSVDLVSG